MWSYSGDPSDSPKDEVRFLLGDTDIDDPQVSDEEITYLLGKFADPYTCAGMAAEAAAAKYAGLIDRTVGSLSIAYSQKSTHYADLAVRLRKQSRSTAATGAGPLTFGIAYEEKETKDADTSLVPDTFDVGFMDNPNVSQVDDRWGP